MAHSIQSQIFNTTLDDGWSQNLALSPYSNILQSIKDLFLEEHCKSYFTIESLNADIITQSIRSVAEKAFNKAKSADLKTRYPDNITAHIIPEPPKVEEKTLLVKPEPPKAELKVLPKIELEELESKPIEEIFGEKEKKDYIETFSSEYKKRWSADEYLIKFINTEDTSNKIIDWVTQSVNLAKTPGDINIIFEKLIYDVTFNDVGRRMVHIAYGIIKLTAAKFADHF
jgi:hypothetical protein